ncbi:hypothetical protein [Mycolicibacterium sp. XJ1819]
MTVDIVSVFVYRRREFRAECTCGYDGRVRRIKGRAVIDALLHASNNGCREGWPLVVQSDRPLPARRGVGWFAATALALASVIIGGAIAFSVPAEADDVADYVAWAHPVICQNIAEKPYISTVEAVVAAVAEDSGLGYGFAGVVVGVAVRDYCPWNRGTVDRYIGKWLQAGVLV